MKPFFKRKLKQKIELLVPESQQMFNLYFEHRNFIEQTRKKDLNFVNYEKVDELREYYNTLKKKN